MKIKVLLLLAAMMVMLSGCNTAQGLGKDIEGLGLLLQGKNKTETRPDVNIDPAAAQREVIEETYVDQYGNPIQPQGSGVKSYPYSQTPAESTSGYIAPAPVVPAGNNP